MFYDWNSAAKMSPIDQELRNPLVLLGLGFPRILACRYRIVLYRIGTTQQWFTCWSWCGFWQEQRCYLDSEISPEWVCTREAFYRMRPDRSLIAQRNVYACHRGEVAWVKTVPIWNRVRARCQTTSISFNDIRLLMTFVSTSPLVNAALRSPTWDIIRFWIAKRWRLFRVRG